MAAKKLTGGNDWSFEPAGGRVPPADDSSFPHDQQKAKISLQKRARGKEVTVIAGFRLSDADRKALAASLRKACGAGGSDGPGGIEIQGDHREKVRGQLTGLGWRVS